MRKGPQCRHVHVASVARQVQSCSFVRVERTTRPIATRSINGLPVAPPARCVVDAALHMKRLDDVRALLAEAVMRQRVVADELLKEVDRAPKRGSGRPRQAAHEVALGARSAPECKQIRILSSSKVLPLLHYNCSLMGPDGWIADPDAYCEESGVAQEVDSVEFHIDPIAWKATMARRSKMVTYGARVLEVPPSRLDTDAPGVRREFEQTHIIGVQSGPPAGIWVRCRPGCQVRAAKPMIEVL